MLRKHGHSGLRTSQQRGAATSTSQKSRPLAFDSPRPTPPPPPPPPPLPLPLPSPTTVTVTATVDMRLLSGLVASSLVTIAVANNVAQLSPDETRLLLAERLGVSRFHELQLQGGDIHRTTLDIALAFGKEQELVDTMFAETPRKGNFVLSLGGMKDNKLDPDLPSIMIVDDSHDNAPTSSSVASLLTRLTAEKAEVSGLHQNTFSKTSTGGLCVSVPKLEELTKLESIPSKSGIDHLLSSLDPSDPSLPQFLLEFAMIRKFMETVLPGLPENGMAYCHAPAVEALIAAHGPSSPEAKTVAALYSNLLAHLPTSISSTVLLLPQSREAHAKRASTETPLSMDQPEPSSKSKTTTDTPAKQLFAARRIANCHNSKESCKSTTADCSGRGSCYKAVKAGPNACWTCKCKPTTIKTANGIKTTTWAGAACQKKDVSVPFNIFLVFGIVMTFLLVAAVNLMTGIGAEELPSVLSAGVAPAKHT